MHRQITSERRIVSKLCHMTSVWLRTPMGGNSNKLNQDKRFGLHTFTLNENIKIYGKTFCLLIKCSNKLGNVIYLLSETQSCFQWRIFLQSVCDVIIQFRHNMYYNLCMILGKLLSWGQGIKLKIFLKIRYIGPNNK